MSEFKYEFEVRDYECDIQGIVNNAVYLNYLEHTRHRYLQSRNLDFARMHDEGKDLVVIRSEIDYKASLKFDDKFYVTVDFSKVSRLKLLFEQKIFRVCAGRDDELILDAKVYGTCVDVVSRKPLLWDID